MVAALLIGFVAGMWTAASPRVPVLVPWLVPLAIGVIFEIAWRHERMALSAGEDAQPNLALLVGAVCVAVAVAGVLAGFFLRVRRTL